MQPAKIETEGYQAIEKVVKNGGNSGRVFVPKSWTGKRVLVILRDPLDQPDE
jgi:putative transposon-encoded protein